MVRYGGCPVPDSDKDGVNDEADKCPAVPGVIRYDGCPVPDTDKDGINDENDKCPTVSGFARYDGCPVPDKDKDGIGDEEDNCPDVFGVVRYRGCPVPDKDKDGVSDEDDKCPDLAGSADNLGCPEISATFRQTAENAARAISFNGSKLNSGSGKGLDELARLLASNKSLYVDVEAGTDARAAAVKAYLVKKGIAEKRIRVTGSDKSTVSLVLSYF